MLGKSNKSMLIRHRDDRHLRVCTRLLACCWCKHLPKAHASSCGTTKLWLVCAPAVHSATHLHELALISQAMRAIESQPESELGQPWKALQSLRHTVCSAAAVGT